MQLDNLAAAAGKIIKAGEETPTAQKALEANKKFTDAVHQYKGEPFQGEQAKDLLKLGSDIFDSFAEVIIQDNKLIPNRIYDVANPTRAIIASIINKENAKEVEGLYKLIDNKALEIALKQRQAEKAKLNSTDLITAESAEQAQIYDAFENDPEVVAQRTKAIDRANRKILGAINHTLEEYEVAAQELITANNHVEAFLAYQAAITEALKELNILLNSKKYAPAQTLITQINILVGKAQGQIEQITATHQEAVLGDRNDMVKTMAVFNQLKERLLRIKAAGKAPAGALETEDEDISIDADIQKAEIEARKKELARIGKNVLEDVATNEKMEELRLANLKIHNSITAIRKTIDPKMSKEKITDNNQALETLKQQIDSDETLNRNISDSEEVKAQAQTYRQQLIKEVEAATLAMTDEALAAQAKKAKAIEKSIEKINKSYKSGSQVIIDDILGELGAAQNKYNDERLGLDDYKTILKKIIRRIHTDTTFNKEAIQDGKNHIIRLIRNKLEDFGYDDSDKEKFFQEAVALPAPGEDVFIQPIPAKLLKDIKERILNSHNPDIEAVIAQSITASKDFGTPTALIDALHKANALYNNIIMTLTGPDKKGKQQAANALGESSVELYSALQALPGIDPAHQSKELEAIEKRMQAIILAFLGQAALESYMQQDHDDASSQSSNSSSSSSSSSSTSTSGSDSGSTTTPDDDPEAAERRQLIIDMEKDTGASAPKSPTGSDYETVDSGTPLESDTPSPAFGDDI